LPVIIPRLPSTADHGIAVFAIHLLRSRAMLLLASGYLSPQPSPIVHALTFRRMPRPDFSHARSADDR